MYSLATLSTRLGLSTRPTRYWALLTVSRTGPSRPGLQPIRATRRDQA